MRKSLKDTEEITYNDISMSIVDAVLVKRQVRYFDVKLNLKGKTYIVPVTLDSSSKSDNFDFSALPDISDEDCGYLLEKIEQTINQMPPLEDCKHIKDHPDYADEFFDDALTEWDAYQLAQSDADERMKSYHINHLPVADDDELITHDFDDWQKMRSIIRSLPTDRQIFYRPFYYSPRCTRAEWDNACDMLSFELVNTLKK